MSRLDKNQWEDNFNLFSVFESLVFKGTARRALSYQIKMISDFRLSQHICDKILKMAKVDNAH